jgi:hypothetical protein
MKKSILGALCGIGVAVCVAACGGHHTLNPCSKHSYIMQCAKNAPGRIANRFSSRPQVFGIDFAYGGPSGQFLRAHGAAFGASYLSDSSKDWTAANIQTYKAAGRGVVSVWEQTCCQALNGYSQGYSDAKHANSEAGLLGMPKNRPIYFAVDTDTSYQSVVSYFRGADHAIGESRVGVYGSYSVVANLMLRHLAAFGWQTLAWSYGARFGPACIYQASINRDWFGYSVDYDYASCRNYGQWFLPKPKPKRKRKPPRVNVKAMRYNNFYVGPFSSPYGQLNERAVVEHYDKLRILPRLNKAQKIQLVKLEKRLKYLADRLAYISLAEGRGWGPFRRGARYQELIHRAQGKRCVSWQACL